MSVTVTVNNKSFELPSPGDEGYAEDLLAFWEEISDVLNTVSAPLDILETDFNFTNNQVTPANVTGLTFPTSNIASFVSDYIITRDDGTTKITEQGQLFGFQGDSGWELGRSNVITDSTVFGGEAGVEFSITSAGQVQYTSQDYTGQLTGTMTFRAKTMQQD